MMQMLFFFAKSFVVLQLSGKSTKSRINISDLVYANELTTPPPLSSLAYRFNVSSISQKLS